MRIVHTIFDFYPGGAELMLADIANEQALAGHNVHIVVLNNVYTEEALNRISPDVSVHLLNRPAGSRNPLWIWRYNRMLWRLSPDIIHFHNDGLMKTVLKRRDTFYAGTVHDTQIDIKGYRRCDKIFAISDAVQHDLKDRLNIESTVVVNGINFDMIEISHKQNCDNSSWKIVQVASVLPSKKGQDILIKAIPLLKKQGIDVKVDFIGKRYDNGELDRLVEEENVADSVAFLGLCDRSYVYSHLKDYDLCCHPARYEGFGLALVEAMGAKIPVLASDLDGPAEILDENRYGLLFESNNPQACADAIEKVITAYPIFKANAQGKAYKHICENYSIKATAENYIAEYQKLINQ